jgi:hypothetical protein
MFLSVDTNSGKISKRFARFDVYHVFRQQTGLVDLDIVCEGHLIRGTFLTPLRFIILFYCHCPKNFVLVPGLFLSAFSVLWI